MSHEGPKPDVEAPALPEERDWNLSAHHEYLLSAGLLAVLVWFVYFVGRSIENSIDYTAIYVPHFHFLFESLGRGEIPWWNPYVGLGRPMLSDIHFAFLYPPTWLFGLGERVGLFLSLWLHSWLLWWGTRGLARELGATRVAAFIAGIVISLSGNYCGRMLSGMLYFVFQECYAPLIFWLTLRLSNTWSWRIVCQMALAVTGMFLCGNGHVFWIIMLGAGLLLAGRLSFDFGRIDQRDAGMMLGQFATVVLVFLGLTAFAWLPYLDLIQNGNRTEPTFAFASFMSAAPRLLATLVSLPAADTRVDWEYNFHLGYFWVIAAVVGCALCRDSRIRALGLVCVFAVVYSLGANTPLFDLFYRVLPGADMFRVPARMMVLATVAVPVVAAVFLSRTEPDERCLRWVGGAAVAFLIWHVALLSAGEGEGAFAPRQVCLLFLGLAVAALLRLPSSSWRGAALIIVVISLVELVPSIVAMKGGYIPPVSIAPLENPNVRAVKQLRESMNLRDGAPPPRANISPELFLRNSGMLFDVADVTADSPLFLRRPWKYMHAVAGITPDPLRNNSLPFDIGVMSPSSLPYVSINLGLDGSGNLIEVERPFPRAYFTSRVIPVEHEQQALEMMMRSGPPQPLAFTESPWEGPAEAQDFFEVNIDRFGHSRIELGITNRNPGILVLNENWFPGWQARRGDAVIEAEPVNVWMRGFRLEPGEQRLVIEFRPRNFMLGIGISFLSLGVVGIVFARTIRRSSRDGVSL